jgi:hypothetical protein
VAVVLAGCGGSSSGPHSLPPLSATPTATTSASPSPTATDSKQAELAAATAVVRRYYALLNNLSNRTDITSFTAIETAECSCRNFLQSLRMLQGRREHYFGTEHITALRAVVDDPITAEVLISYDATKGGIASDAGKVVSTVPPIKGAALNYRLTSQGGQWRIFRVDLISKGRS